MLSVPPIRGEFPFTPSGGGGPLFSFERREKGLFKKGKARGSAPRVGGLAVGKPGHHTRALPQSRRLALHDCHSSSQHRMRSDCPLGLSLAGGSSLMAAVRPRCRGEGVSPAFTGRRGRELTTPAVGLRSRRCVVKPDPITPHGQSSRGAAEGEGRFPTAMATALFQNTSLHFISHSYFNTTKQKS